MKGPRSRFSLPVDLTLFSATLLLAVIGLLMVFSSSYVKTLDNEKLGFDALYYVKKQGVGFVIGLLMLFLMMNFDYRRLQRLSVPFMLVSIGMLMLVWAPHIGVRINNSSRWINLVVLQVQPSELAKLAVTLYFASVFARPTIRIRRWGDLLPPIFVLIFVVALIEREPDLGTAFVLFVSGMAQAFYAGARKRHIALVVAVCALFGLIFGMAFGHRQNRILAFMDPNVDPKGIGYQIRHAKQAVGSGMLDGMGFGRGREKYYLPQGNTDFIFATMAEELGFFGVLVVIGLLVLITWRGILIALRTRDRFGAITAAGISALISVQSLLNMGVATGMFPATGVPLPFISYGSSSLILLMMSVGILLNIARFPAVAVDIPKPQPGQNTPLGRAS